MTDNNQDQHQEFREEYAHIKKDLKKLIFWNLLIAALLVGLYYANKQTGFLQRMENLIGGQ